MPISLVQAFAKGSFRVLDEINQGLDSDRETLIFRLLSKVAHGLHAAPDDAAEGDCGAAAATGDSSLAAAPEGRGSTRSKKKRQCSLEDSSSPSKRQRTAGAAAPAPIAAGDAKGEEGGTQLQQDGNQEEGGVQYVLLTPHVIPNVDLSSIALQFIFNGPGRFTQAQFDLHGQIRRLKARRNANT